MPSISSETGLPAHVTTGARFGDFLLGEELGRGAFGVVFAARQVSLERDVALKLLRIDAGRPATASLRFRTEGVAAARLDDPRVVRVFAIGEQDGVAWIAMERVFGRSVAHAMRSWSAGDTAAPALPPPRDAAAIRTLARFLAEVARGLAAAHAAEVLHRDIKPSNLLVDPDGRPRIIDFGLAQLLGSPGVTATGDTAGTPYYMSPEQVRAVRAGVDHRTDVYSLGVVAYELLTQQRPFEGATSQQVFHSIATRQPRPIRALNPLVPPELAMLCEKAMEKDVRHRFANAAEFAGELERFACGERVQTTPPSPLARLSRFVRRHPLPATAVLTALLAGAAGAYLALPRTPMATIVCEAEQLAGARVTLRAIEPIHWQLGAARDVGVTPLRLRLPLGHYRLELERDGAFAELTRELAAADEVVTIGAHVRLLPMAEVQVGMVEVAAGPFRFGTEGQTEFAERRPQQVDLPAFLIDSCEVTNAQYRAYVVATGSKAPPTWPKDWRTSWQVAWDALPVSGLNQSQAQGYAEWAGKRLPTEQEWEKAARGVEGWDYPWGADGAPGQVKLRARVGVQNRNQGNWRERFAAYLTGAVAVASLPAGRSPFGLHDTVGNVSEWTETAVAKIVGGVPVVMPGLRMVRGSSWDDGESFWPLSHIKMTAATEHVEFLGFRCAKSVRP
jgi:formylglycine-generating enzyme required for sulfatase activity